MNLVFSFVAVQSLNISVCCNKRNTLYAIVNHSVNSIAAGTTNTIGYISMGSIDDTVKTVKFEGVEATAENVKNGSYTLSRPFTIVYKSEDDLSEAAKLFIDFIMSDAGQLIAENEGYISVSDSL